MPSEPPISRVLNTTLKTTCARPNVIRAKYTPRARIDTKPATKPSSVVASKVMPVAAQKEGATSFSTSAET